MTKNKGPRTLVGEHGGGVGAYAVSAVDAIREAVEQAKLRGMAEYDREILQHELTESLKGELLEAVSQQRERLESAMADERGSYERTHTRNAENIDRQAAAHSRRLSAMSREELETEAAMIIDGKRIPDPVELDILSGLVKESPETHERLRGAAKERRLYEPWRHSETGAEIARALDGYTVAEQNPGSIPVYMDGKFGHFTVSDLLQDTGDE